GGDARRGRVDCRNEPIPSRHPLGRKRTPPGKSPRRSPPTHPPPPRSPRGLPPAPRGLDPSRLRGNRGRDGGGRSLERKPPRSRQPPCRGEPARRRDLRHPGLL